jgi:hypothetical protein
MHLLADTFLLYDGMEDSLSVKYFVKVFGFDVRLMSCFSAVWWWWWW